MRAPRAAKAAAAAVAVTAAAAGFAVLRWAETRLPGPDPDHARAHRDLYGPKRPTATRPPGSR